MAYKPFDLTGKVALVTGGNSGIGLGIAKAVAEAGADVAIWGTNAAKNETARGALGGTGRKVVALECDVGDEAAVERAFAQTVSELGRVDGCFANAGVSGRGLKSFLDMTSEEWNRVMRVNLDGAFYTFRTAARHMVERGGGGVLVGTASLAAIEAAPRGEHYAATKGGVISMCRAMAVEFARYGVRAHAILPGWIETNMTANAVANPKFAGNVMPRIPMRRWGEGDDFGGIAVYLMSSASKYHTGDTFVIDGGIRCSEGECGRPEARASVRRRSVQHRRRDGQALGDGVQALVAGPKRGSRRKPNRGGEMRVDISDAGARQGVSLDHRQHLLVVSQRGLRQVGDKADDRDTVAHGAEGNLPGHARMAENPVVLQQALEPWVGRTDVVDPDRTVGQNHSGSDRRRGAAVASGSLPPSRARRRAASR